jgi:hypothetical protein
MSSPGAPFDYHGALVVVEAAAGEIVFIHPPGGPAQAPASLQEGTPTGAHARRLPPPARRALRAATR